MGIHFFVPALSLLSPESGIFLFGKIFQTLQELPRQARSRLWVELQCLGFKFLDTHGRILHQTGSLNQPIARWSPQEFPSQSLGDAVAADWAKTVRIEEIPTTSALKP